MKQFQVSTLLSDKKLSSKRDGSLPDQLGCKLVCWVCLCGSKPMGSHFGVGAPPILEPIFVGIGMCTGGASWILTHGRVSNV